MNEIHSKRRDIPRASVLEAARSMRLVGLHSTGPARLIALLCDDSISGDELTLRIESDPVLCARVLKVANSPYYGQQRTVATLRRALLVLGVRALRGIAAAACIDQIVPQRMAALPDGPALIRHSLASALASEMLAATRAPGLGPTAFVAGLLHNMGVMIQAVVDPEGTSAMVAARRAHDSRDIRLLEQDYCSLEHERAVGIVFEEWQLPPALVAAGSHHHRPLEAPEAFRTLTQLVGTGAHLALLGGNTFSLEPAACESGSETTSWGLLSVTPEALPAFQSDLQERLGHLTSALA